LLNWLCLFKFPVSGTACEPAVAAFFTRQIYMEEGELCAKGLGSTQDTRKKSWAFEEGVWRVGD